MLSNRIGLGFTRRLTLTLFVGGLFLVSAQLEVRARPPTSDGIVESGVVRIPDWLLDSAQEIVGTPTVGEMGITETVEQIMARQATIDAAGGPPFEIRPMRNHEPREREPRDPRRKHLHQNPDSPATSQWPPPNGEPAPDSPQLIGPTNFLAVQISNTAGFIPPDTMGAVGPSQIVVCVNGRIKSFNRSGTPDSALNATTDGFFNSVRNGSGTSDPQVRYDRTSGRWFIIMVNVASTNNRILIAASSGTTITNSSSFTFFFIQHNNTGGDGTGDNNTFFDYPSLGIDANALYIGGNLFTSGGSFSRTSGHVIRKTSVLSGGPLVDTAFRGLVVGSGAGPYTPRGVDNDDPSATEGYFIGVDNVAFGLLQMRRVGSPGGTPTISGNLSITVPATAFPILVPASGSTTSISALDDRLFEAAIHRNTLTGVSTLWTAHNIQVNSSGVASSSGGRDGSRWYEIKSLSTTPTLNQSGTLFSNASASPRSFWIPSVAMSGQGHMALGCSYASATTNDWAGVAAAGRLSSDPLGTTQSPTIVQAGLGSYTLVGNGSNRWGDFSFTHVDPNDNMTMWTFQEYANATNSWAVRVVQLLAPPPATPSGISPSTVCQGSMLDLVLTGTSSSGSGFYDPGNGYSNHISASVGGTGVAVNSVTFTDPTHVTLNITVDAGAAPGARTVTVTNPDGQSTVSASGILTIPNCNDGNSCTMDTCSNGVCGHENHAGFCDDGDLCTVSDVCVGGICTGIPINCGDGNDCTTDTCQTGNCVHTSNSNPCDDGNACTSNDICAGGTCNGTSISCDDGNVCTTDNCDPLTGCMHTNNHVPCDDGDACTIGDVCSGGSCSGIPIDCNDGNVCTDDSCDHSTGCQHPNNTNVCDDHHLCTDDDVCGGGFCSGTPVSDCTECTQDGDCDDLNACTTDTCQAGFCIFTDNTDPCDDGNSCTANDTCSGGVCVGGAAVVCNDGNVCTDDSCNPAGGCVYVNNSSPCDDGDACTTYDTCMNGGCVGGPPPDCNDHNVCTDDSCIPASGCHHANNASACDDGNACTTNDTCAGGSCAGGPAPNCDDGNVCTDDSCTPGSGCTHVDNTNSCNDGHVCTSGDVCSGGVCMGTPIPNCTECTQDSECNDGNVCTTDTCQSGRCVYTPNSNPCDDGNACTTNDTCSGGSCVGGASPNCNDNNPCTDDSCDMSQGCRHVNNSNLCNDGNACTANDTCGGGSCSGTTISCNDGNACTDDSCNPASGCQFVNNTSPCDRDGDSCTQDQCDGQGNCVFVQLVCNFPTTPLADPTGVDKTRYFSFQITSSATAAGSDTALQVTLVSLMHPNPPNLPQYPPPNFSAFEGSIRWVGPVSDCQETETPLTAFKCARLQCSPNYVDWVAVLGGQTLHISGVEVVPSSTYDVRQFSSTCLGNENTCTGVSSTLRISTSRWGDVLAPFQAPSPAPLTQPNVTDIAAAVDKFKSVPTAIIVARADVNPAIPNERVDIADVANIVDGFKNLAYPYPGPAACP
ncbi:MAG: hypothetical protein HY287_11760 [Planctomycetes bacterium]|nr:hypothetical protein [Planctomycetota bacterium]